jgi:hypothetical protein
MLSRAVLPDPLDCMKRFTALILGSEKVTEQDVRAQDRNGVKIGLTLVNLPISCVKRET